MISFKLRAAPPAAYPAVQVQSYALKAMSDRGLTQTISVNRRNVLPLAGEVIQVPKYPCLFAVWFGCGTENTLLPPDVRTAIRASIQTVENRCMYTDSFPSTRPCGRI